MTNAFVHVELATSDVGSAKSFYKKMFKWKLEDMKMGPGMTYTMIKPESGPGGGMMPKPMPEAPTMWLTYVQVDSVKKSIAKAKGLGAQIIVERQEVPGMGYFGIFTDPTGATLGIWEPIMPGPEPKKAKAAAKPAAKKTAKKATKRAKKNGRS